MDDENKSEVRVVADTIKIADTFYIYLDKDWLNPGDFDSTGTVEILSKPRLVRRKGQFCYKYAISDPVENSPVNIGDFFIEGPNVKKEGYIIPTYEELTPGTEYEEYIPEGTYQLVIMDMSTTPPTADKLGDSIGFWVKRTVPELVTPNEYPTIFKMRLENNLRKLIADENIRVKNK